MFSMFSGTRGYFRFATRLLSTSVPSSMLYSDWLSHHQACIKYNEYKCKTSTYQKSFFLRTTRIWNCLSGELNLNCTSINSFKSILLEYYIAALNFYDAEDPRSYKTVCLKCNFCRSLARPVTCCNSLFSFDYLLSLF